MPLPRRTLVQGFAWAIPVATVATTLPAFAASPQCTPEGTTDLVANPGAVTMTIAPQNGTGLIEDSLPSGYTEASFGAVLEGSSSGPITYTAAWSGANADGSLQPQPFELIIELGGSSNPVAEFTTSDSATGSYVAMERLGSSTYRVHGQITQRTSTTAENFRVYFIVTTGCAGDYFSMLLEIAMPQSGS